MSPVLAALITPVVNNGFGKVAYGRAELPANAEYADRFHISRQRDMWKGSVYYNVRRLN